MVSLSCMFSGLSTAYPEVNRVKCFPSSHCEFKMAAPLAKIPSCAELLRVLASPRVHGRFLHATSACHKAQAAKYKISKDGNKPLTYEMANPPHFIGVRKSWNSWHTSNLWEQPGGADRTFEDMFIRKFLLGTFHNCLADEVIIKRRHNTIYVALLLLRKLDPQKYYFLLGYTETLLSHFLKCVVKVEVSVVPRKVVYKYI